MYAGVQFPMAESGDLERELGARHRAAVGMSQESDAVVLVVSEETGDVSIAERGQLIRKLTPEGLRGLLTELLGRGGEGRAAPNLSRGRLKQCRWIYGPDAASRLPREQAAAVTPNAADVCPTRPASKAPTRRCPADRRPGGPAFRPAGCRLGGHSAAQPLARRTADR